MKKTTFVCYGNSPRDNAFVYNESPRNGKSEEFFAFILPGNPVWSSELRELFRMAISTSRMGSARSYFIRFIDSLKEKFSIKTDLKDVFLDSIILLLIKRGNEIHFLHNRDLNIVHWDGSKQPEKISRFTSTLEFSFDQDEEQPDLFNKSLEELFLLRKVENLTGKHTLIFTPSVEFADRNRELFLNSIFFPSFEVPDTKGVNLGTNLHLPAIHWNIKSLQPEIKESRLKICKLRKISIPIVSGIIAAVMAAAIFFWPFSDSSDPKVQEDKILLSASDVSENIAEEKYSSNKEKENKNVSSAESSKAGKTAEKADKQNVSVKPQNDSKQESVKSVITKIELKRAWRKKFTQPVTSSPVLCGNNVMFGCRDGFIYAFSENGDFKWKNNLGAGVGSSPLCSEDRKVIVCDYQGDIVYFDSENGDVLWKTSLGSKIVSTPSITRKRLFTGTMAGDLYSIGLENGEKGWKKHLGSAIWSSIVTGKDFIIAATVDGHLIKLDLQGNILWITDPGGEIYSTPICIEKRDFVIIGTNNKLISAFSLSDGSLLWQYTVSGMVRGTPATDGEKIIIGTDDGKIYSFSMSGRILWMQDVGNIVRSKPLIYGKVVFITGYNTKLTAIDINSGNIIDTFGVESAIYSSPLYFNGRMYFGSNDGFFHSIDIDKKD